MEDLLYILFVVGIVISSVVSNNKRQRAARKAAEARAREEAEHELMETERRTHTAPHSTPQPTITPRPATPASTPRQGSALHPDSQEIIIPEVESPRNQATRPQISHNTRPTTANTTESEPHPITADFDAKKAVVWAEILKPKFEEE